MEKIIFNVNGIMYRSKKIVKFVANNIDTGDILYLELEPDNKHDKYAVKVLFEDEIIGYVESDSSEEISQLLETSRDYDCTVISCFADWDMDVSESGRDIEIVTDIDLLAEVVFKD